MTAFNNYEDFIAARVQQLRSQKNISARKMSLSIGQNEGYITQIENKQNLPSMEGFLYICRYLEITPEEFFASDNQNPEMLRKMVEDIKTLTPGLQNKKGKPFIRLPFLFCYYIVLILLLQQQAQQSFCSSSSYMR